MVWTLIPLTILAIELGVWWWLKAADRREEERFRQRN